MLDAVEHLHCAFRIDCDAYWIIKVREQRPETIAVKAAEECLLDRPTLVTDELPCQVRHLQELSS